MHNAPPVVYPLGRSPFQGWLLLGLWLSGVGLLALWWLAAAGADWRFWIALAVVLGAGGAAGWSWKNTPIGQLRWDGQSWCWGSQTGQFGSPAKNLSVALDFQRILLLGLQGSERATVWLWADRAALPERWLDLRRAVYSRQQAQPPGADS